MTLLQNNFWNIINLNWLVSTSGGKSWEVFTNEFYTSQSFSWSRDFLMFLGGLERKESIPANIYLFKVNNRNARKRCEIFSKLTIKTPERRQRLLGSFCDFCTAFEHYNDNLLEIEMKKMKWKH